MGKRNLLINLGKRIHRSNINRYMRENNLTAVKFNNAALSQAAISEQFNFN